MQLEFDDFSQPTLAKFEPKLEILIENLNYFKSLFRMGVKLETNYGLELEKFLKILNSSNFLNFTNFEIPKVF